MKDLQNFVSNYGLGISKKNLVEKAYRQMEAKGYDVILLNDIYLIVEGMAFQFIKSRKQNAWIVKAF